MVLRMYNDINFHIATIIDSKDMADFKTIVNDNGIQFRIAKQLDGSLKIQSILFPKNKYSSFSAHISANLIESFLK